MHITIAREETKRSHRGKRRSKTATSFVAHETLFMSGLVPETFPSASRTDFPLASGLLKHPQGELVYQESAITQTLVHWVLCLQKHTGLETMGTALLFHTKALRIRQWQTKP